MADLNDVLDQVKKKQKGKIQGSSQGAQTHENTGFEDLVNKKDSDFLGSVKAEAQEKKEKQERDALEKRNKEARKNLKKHEVLLTDITGGDEARSKVNHPVYVYPDDHFPKEIRGAIPPVDPDFIWNPDDLEALIIGKKTGHRVLLVGDPGTGKTTSAKQFAAHTKQPFFQFNGKENVEASSFLGNMGAKNGNTEWTDGTLTQALKHGAMCCIDEVMKMPPGVQMACQTIYEKGGFIVLDDKDGTYEDKVVIPKEEFFLVFTDNVKGGGEDLDKFAASSIQDTSSLDRVGITKNTSYLPAGRESTLLVNKYGIDHSQAQSLVKFAGLIRNAFSKGQAVSLTLSPRGLFAICDLMNSGLSLKGALDYAYLNKLPRDEDVQAARGFLQTVGL